MTNKIKVTLFTSVVTMGVVVSVVAAHAATTPLTASCSGTLVVSALNVNDRTIRWNGSPAGGNPPYTYTWSGNALSGAYPGDEIKSSLSTQALAWYGTFVGILKITDASMNAATATCTVIVPHVSAGTGAPIKDIRKSTLNVFVKVVGGPAKPSDFTASVTGPGANNPYVPSANYNTIPPFAGSAEGTSVLVNSDKTYSVTTSQLKNYTTSQRGNCSGPIAPATNISVCTHPREGVTCAYVAIDGQPPPCTPDPGAYCSGPFPLSSDSCTITATYNSSASSASPTGLIPTLLSINPNGLILARGMTVTSVATNSFQGTVWGVTYTVNWSSNRPEFYLSRGNMASSITNPADQIIVGDTVGVSGRVMWSSPSVITANVVRNYSTTQLRPSKSI